MRVVNGPYSLVGNISLGKNIKIENGVATYVGPQAKWIVLNPANADTTFNPEGLESWDYDYSTGFITADLKNATAQQKGNPVAGTTMAFKLYDPRGTEVVPPFKNKFHLRFRLEIDSTSLPATGSKAWVFVGIANNAGGVDESTVSLISGWGVDSGSPTGIKFQAYSQAGASIENAGADNYIVETIVALFGYTPVAAIVTAQPESEVPSNLAIGFNPMPSEDSNYKIVVIVGLNSINDTPVGPHTIKFKASYYITEVSTP